jgi:acetyltransferase-like isoleucine patch superfamily enzyme
MLKKVLLIVVAFTPFNKIRIGLYRLLFGYNISNDSYIGFGNLLDCKFCKISGGFIGNFNSIQCNKFIMHKGSKIRKLNKFLHVNTAEIGEDAYIQVRNTIVGTRPATCPYKEHENFYIGAKSILTRRHTFDLSDTISIGEDVTFAGNGTEVWTHGFDINHIKIQGAVTIGDKGYIGSQCIISLGVKIADNVLIGAGTVVSKSITESGFYVSSHLIRKGDVQNLIEHKDAVEYNGAKFIKKHCVYRMFKS